jgi:hypothetical protein
VTNDDKEIQVDTKFLVIWLSQTSLDDVKTECPQTYDSIYQAIYEDMEAADATDAIQKYNEYKSQLNKTN